MHQKPTINVHELTKILRRLLMVVILFGLPFAIYYPIFQLPAPVRNQPPTFLQQTLWYQFAAVLLLAFIFSALEGALAKSDYMGFVFGIIFSCGWVFSYHFFFGYPTWVIPLYVIGCGLLFGFPCAVFEAIGKGFIEWIQNRKTVNMARRDYGTLQTHLVSVEAKITSLKQELNIYERNLTQISKLESEIQKIIALDPANLAIKTNKMKDEVQSISKECIVQEEQKIREGLQEVNQIRREVERKLNALRMEEKIIRSKLHETKHHLYELTRADLANVQIKLQMLRKKWAVLNGSELERLAAHSEIAQVVKTEISLGRRLKNIRREIDLLIHQIQEVNQRERILQLRNIIIQQRKINENSKLHKYHLDEIKAELEKLEKERVWLLAQLECLEMM